MKKDVVQVKNLTAIMEVYVRKCWPILFTAYSFIPFNFDFKFLELCFS